MNPPATAAHLMPQFAGQGLKGVVRDAANRAWKVAAQERIIDTMGAFALLSDSDARLPVRPDRYVAAAMTTMAAVGLAPSPCCRRSCQLAAVRLGGATNAPFTPLGHADLSTLRRSVADRRDLFPG